MKKFIALTKDGLYVERFFGASVMLTIDRNRAGIYTKSVLEKRFQKLEAKFGISMIEADSLTDEEHKKLMSCLYPKDNSKKFSK